MLVDVAKVSQACNITIQRVGQLVAEGMPKEGRGKYDLGKCMIWYIRYLQKALERRAVPTPDGNYTQMGDVKVRSVLADAEMKELELAKARGQLVPLLEVEAKWSEIVLAAKARILTTPARIAAELVGETSRNLIQAKIEKALKEAMAQLAGGRSL